MTEAQKDTNRLRAKLWYAANRDTKYREYRIKNVDRRAETMKKWRIENREKIAESKHRYNETNRIRISEFRKKQRIENPEKFRTQCKQWRLNNPERVIELTRDSYANNCEKRKEARREYYHKDIEKSRANSRKYYQANRDKLRIRQREWARERKLRDPETAKRKANEYQKKRFKNDPQFKIVILLRTRIRRSLNGFGKIEPTEQLIGTTINDLIVYLEAQFRDGMTWQNQGLSGWHIDHIIPCASFDLTDPEQQRRCFHYTNIQPLWWWENLAKGDKLVA